MKIAGRRETEAGRYQKLVQGFLRESEDRDSAMHRAIGGEFEALGLIERDLLISQGLRPDGTVVDVGCGSGRLAGPLSSYLTGDYLGTDVVPELLEYARRSVARPDWRFELVDDLTIPAADASADMVCFFSVFTHLRHEESYCYLQEAKRVLRPQGCIVFSFLEFAIFSHWSVFELDLTGIGSDAPLNQFMSRDGIRAWAYHLDLTVKEIYDGDVENVPLTEPVTLDSGQHYEELGALGQSVAVLSAA